MTQPMKVAKPLPSEDRPGNAVKDPKTGKLTPKSKAATNTVESIGHNSGKGKTEIVSIFNEIREVTANIKELQGLIKDKFAVLREKGIPTKQAKIMLNLDKLDPADRKNYAYDLIMADDVLRQGELFGSIISDEALKLVTTKAQGLEDPDVEPEVAEVDGEDEEEEAPSPTAKKK